MKILTSFSYIFKEELLDDGVMLSKRKSKVKTFEDVDLKDQHPVENSSGDSIPTSTEETPDKMEETIEEESSENMDVSLQESEEVPNKIKRVY